MAASLEHGERPPDLAQQAQRLLVHQEQVWVEDPRRVLDDGRPERQGVLDIDMETQAGVVAAPQFDDPRDPSSETVSSDDGGAGQDQDVELLVMLDQGMRNDPAAAKVAQPK